MMMSAAESASWALGPQLPVKTSFTCAISDRSGCSILFLLEGREANTNWPPSSAISIMMT